MVSEFERVYDKCVLVKLLTHIICISQGYSGPLVTISNNKNKKYGMCLRVYVLSFVWIIQNNNSIRFYDVMNK